MSSEIKGQVFNSWKPPAKAGETVRIEVEQTLRDDENQNVLNLTKPKVVSLEVQGPQLTLDPSDILGVYPAPGSEESPDEYLPHIALAGRTLPWEREGPMPDLPWLTLLLINESDSIRRLGQKGSVELGPTTVGEIKTSDPLTYERLTKKKEGVRDPGLGLPDSTEILAAHIPNRLLDAILPIGEDIALLSLLCHGKRTLENAAQQPAQWAPSSGYAVGAQVTFERSTFQCIKAHKPEDGGEPPRLPTIWKVMERDAAIIISNRLPYAGNPNDAIDPVRHTALLVSLERRSDLLKMSRFSDLNASTVFIVLHHWSFKPSDGGDFEEVMKRIRIRPNGGALRFGNLPKINLRVDEAPLTENFEALLNKDGYFIKPLQHEQSGDVAFRSPLRPFPPPGRNAGIAVRAAPEEFEDAEGPADYSHAAAFEIGRLMALADTTILEDLRHIHEVLPELIVDEQLINPLPDSLQKADWVTNPQWVENPWNIQQNRMIKTETELTRNGVADYSGIERLEANWKQTVMNQLASIVTPVAEPVDQIEIETVTGDILAKKFNKVINAAKL